MSMRPSTNIHKKDAYMQYNNFFIDLLTLKELCKVELLLNIFKRLKWEVNVDQLICICIYLRSFCKSNNHNLTVIYLTLKKWLLFL